MTIPLLDWNVDGNIVAIGFFTGLTYAILAVGLVLIYRSTRVINFAHGEIGALGSAVLALMVLDWHLNFWIALVAVVALGAALAALIELGIVRRLFRQPRLVLLVATIGVSQIVYLGRVLLPKVENVGPYPTPLNREIVIGNLLLGSQHLMVLAFVPAVIVGLSMFLNRTAFGIAIRAAADNQDRALLGGIPIQRVSTVVWAIGGGLAVLTVVLLDPLRASIVGFPSPSVGPGLLVRALAAALVGGMVSVPLAMAGGVTIGMLEAVVFANAGDPGLVEVLLLLIVIVLVMTRVRSGQDSDGFSLGPRIRPVPAAALTDWRVRHLSKIGWGGLLLFAFCLPLVMSAPSDSYLFTRVVVFAMIALSATVLTGWAGQLSLGQLAFVGVGALTATSLVSRGMNFPAAVCYAAVAGGLCALLVGFPALRVRGHYLAITTLAFGVAAQGWFFRQEWFGTQATFVLPRSEVFGFLDLANQRTYYWTCLVAATIIGLLIMRLRGTGSGRSIIAVRDNAPSAASFTVSPTVTTLSAFVFSGAVAGFAGALYAGALVTFNLDGLNTPPIFGPGESLSLIALIVIGGLGSVPGAILGALYIVGLPAIFGGTPEVSVATSGVGLLALLLFAPGGLAQGLYALRDLIVARVMRSIDAPDVTRVAAGDAQLPVRVLSERAPEATREVSAAVAARRKQRVVLDVEDVAVDFGGRLVLQNAYLQVQQGEIVGLIGSNGAGKSTLMNVVSGFVTPVSGSVRLHGTTVTSMAPHERARLGMGRVFQDARLFSELTLRETVSVALEARERSEFLPSLLSLPPSRRAEQRKREEADSYIDFLGLGRYASTYLGELSTGTRRIVEMCCLLAQGSSLLLLDEPTAGVAQRETEAFGPLIQRIRAELDASVLIIEHDIPLIMSMSNRVYCYAAGTLIAEGAPEDVRNDPAVVAAYLGTDQRAIDRSDAGAAPRPIRPAPRQADAQDTLVLPSTSAR